MTNDMRDKPEDEPKLDLPKHDHVDVEVRVIVIVYVLLLLGVVALIGILS